MSVLLVAEHNHRSILPASYAAVTAAQALSDEVVMLVAGYECEAAASEAAAIKGVSRVLHVDNKHLTHFLAENMTSVIVNLARDYAVILAAATTTSKNIMPRVAAKLNVAQISDVISMESDNIFVRPIYAGNAHTTIKSLDPVKVITIRTTAFAEATKGNHAEIQSIHIEPIKPLSTFIRYEMNTSARPALSSAKCVVSGGRGLQNKENFSLIEALADCLGAAVGASRAAVDAGFAPNDYQIGQTGKVIAPDLYIAVGISGAIQHIAGMKDSRVIVAINKDKDAPIFQIADYGLVGDLFELVPQLIAQLRQSS